MEMKAEKIEVLKDREYGTVYSTMDYYKFKSIKGNRHINSRNYIKLTKSMEEEQLIIPIIVNDNYEIIDGQHRFMCAKNLGLPVYYLMVNGYSINQVKRANLVSSNWTKEDYLNMHITDGIESYEKFKNLLVQSKLNISDLIKLYAVAQNKNSSQLSYEFETGSFVDEGTEKVENFLICLEDFDYYKNYKQQSFVGAFLKLFTYPTFDIERMREKSKTRQSVLESLNSGTLDDYLNILCNKMYSFGPTKKPIYYDVNTKRFYS